jgi:hypothetical protein
MRTQRGSNKTGIFLIFLIFGLYFLNYSLNFIALPSNFEQVNKILVLIGGGLLILGGFKFLSSRRYMPGY